MRRGSPKEVHKMLAQGLVALMLLLGMAERCCCWDMAPRRCCDAGAASRWRSSRSRTRKLVRRRMAADDSLLQKAFDEIATEERVVEMCTLDETGEIEECEMVSAGDIERLVGLDEAFRILNDPDGLVFAVPPQLRSDDDGSAASADEGATKKPLLFTVADWKVCITEDSCEVRKFSIRNAALASATTATTAYFRNPIIPRAVSRFSRCLPM